MPPKAKIAAPIDRPLSRAYLREFAGWSTAYPPGLSDPTTLRIMENVQINRDGSARVRPGLRYLSYAVAPDSPAPGTGIGFSLVGTHEVFFLNDGSKAYLFAVREADDTVGFRVLVGSPLGQVVKLLTAVGVDFAIEGDINFTAATTYVKYLQIDNKIFALSNAGESMRRFEVGEVKRAKKMESITRPSWELSDQLSIVHPDSVWYQVGESEWTRTNLVEGGSFEHGVDLDYQWWPVTLDATKTLVEAGSGGYPTRGTRNMKVTLDSTGDELFFSTMNMPVVGGRYYRGSLTLSEDLGIDPTVGVQIRVQFVSSGGWNLGPPVAAHFAAGAAAAAPFIENVLAPANAVAARLEVVAFAGVLVWNIDEMFFEEVQSGVLTSYFDGDTPDTEETVQGWAGTTGLSTSTQSAVNVGTTIPVSEVPTANTLISINPEDNVYSFGFFYTFSNEVGESAASRVTIVRAQRPWAGWRWEKANSNGEPNGEPTSAPSLAADQLVAFMPQEAYDAALAQGAVSWNLYMFTWSDQSPVPQTAVRVGTKELSDTADYGRDGWQRVTPVVVDQVDDFAALPSLANRYNYSDPSKGGQGLVAADRMIMVFDPTASAVIRWSANQQGDYSNFTASKGGGYKTLTSGNLYIPACVKLWQNPQSVDTLTVLCMGIDGHSTSYYMMPAEVSAQSETTQIMGFEETTATPGTTSPYGVEVFNNALYHPLDDQLMKSTANNYNISHKTQTENIRDKWEDLSDKHQIVSSQYDGRLYYIVHNPGGAELEDGCFGNEIWVFDATAETGTWSRWLIQAHSLRKIEQNGKIYMSVVRPDGIYYLDPEYDLDDKVDVLGGVVGIRTIPWRLETNTQGANRAHDAWCRLQQANITVGNFTGAMRYGIKSWDLHGKEVTVEKIYRSPQGDVPLLDEPFDHEDMLLIRRDLKEWFFFAESLEEAGEHHRSFGQINLVQYRYAPVSVNVGYEYGSVETFEYGHAGALLEDRTNINGIPIPVLDGRRP